MIFPLVRREMKVFLSDKGRIAEFLVFPVSAVIVWGFFVLTGGISKDFISSVIVSNMAWSIAYIIQASINIGMMSDVWSSEISVLLKNGVNKWAYVFSKAVFSVFVSLSIGALLVFLSTLAFSIDAQGVVRLTASYPQIFLLSVGVGLAFSGAILLLGKSHAYISWTGLQVLMTFSSPYLSYLELPPAFRYLSYLMPYTHVFEYLRYGQAFEYLLSSLYSVAFMIIGSLIYFLAYEKARRNGMLSMISR